ncbi:MAG: FAD-dependent oxidoreductase [Christensenellales bacterium]
MFDVLIIGGGVIGCLIARELSRYELNCCLLEKEWDVAMGASGANSGIVHAGYDPRAGTNMARFNREGRALFEQLSRELDVPFKKNGSLVLAFDENEEQKLARLMENGRKNGVPSLSLLSKEEVIFLEPHVSGAVRRALYAPSAGITCPYSLTIAAAENAVQNGAHLFTNQKVLSIEKKDGYFSVRTQSETFAAGFIVNCAGVYSDEISGLAGAETFGIRARKGEYLLFDKTADKPQRILFQAPAALSKGVLVTATVHGNLLVGPSATDTPDREDVSVTAEGLSYIAALGERSYPHFRLKDAIAQFAGLRAVSDQNDFVIQPSEIQKGFLHVAGISSPGLTAAPAIARYVVCLLDREGFILREKKNFNPFRSGIKAFDNLSNEERNALIKKDPAYGKILCRCEHVTEAEIIESIRRPVGAKTLDGVKRRVRAGMGRCQGGFCSSSVIALLARELNVPLQEVTKRGGGSNILLGKTK